MKSSSSFRNRLGMEKRFVQKNSLINIKKKKCMQGRKNYFSKKSISDVLTLVLCEKHEQNSEFLKGSTGNDTHVTSTTDEKL